MGEAPEPLLTNDSNSIDKMVRWKTSHRFTILGTLLTVSQDVDETPDYTEDSDTNPNTTASSVAGDQFTADGRKKRSEVTQLRRSVFGKKHDHLAESKVCFLWLPCL